MTILVISGASGSGKTTISRRIQSILRSCGINARYEEWELSPEYYFFLRLPLKIINMLFPRIYKINQECLAQEFRLNAERRSLKFLLWALVVWLDRLSYFYSLKMFKYCDVIIIHRYIYGLMVTLLEYYGWGHRGLTHKLVSCFPKPNIIIVLDAPPSVLIERSEDYPSPSAADFWRERYLEITNQYGFPLIDSARRESPIIRDCIRIIGSSLSKKPEDIILHILSDPFDYGDSELLRNLSLKHLDIEYIISKASQCDTGYQVLQRLSKIPLPEFWRKYISKNMLNLRRKHEIMLRNIGLLHNLFQENHIKYVVFKTCPPYKSVTNDIDVLVDDYEKALTILKTNGWITELRHIILREIHLVKDHITLDLHQETRFINRKKVLANRKLVKIDNSNLTYIPQDEIELLSIVNNCIADQHVTLGAVHYIRGLASQSNINWKYFSDLARVYDLSKVKTILGIVRLKDILFYQGKMEHTIPHIEKASIPIDRLCEPIVHLSSWSMRAPGKGFFLPLALCQEFARDPKRIIVRTLEKLFDRDFQNFEV